MTAPLADLHPATVRRLADTARLGRPVVLLETTASTNDVARAAAGAGAAEGALYVAAGQAAGRGRAGRRWIHPDGGLAFSLLLRPGRSPEGLTLLFGLAVLRAIDRFAPGGAVKWPNDIVIDGRKAGGILAEAFEDAVVVGTGLNVDVDPARLAAAVDVPAVSLSEVAGRRLDRREVLAAILSSAEEMYGLWEREGFASFRGAYEERLLWRGERVAAGGKTGVLSGVDESGCLVLETATGRRIVAAGDVSLRKEES